MRSAPVKVIFRVFKDDGDVLALFPTETYDRSGNVMSYQHIGQHSGADYTHCIRTSRPAKPAEYTALKRELESIGYVLQVRKRK